MTKGKGKFYFISLNVLRMKHAELISWIQSESSEREMSISSFCIYMLKKMKSIQEDEKNGEEKKDS